jgi:hypothetical protein
MPLFRQTNLPRGEARQSRWGKAARRCQPRTAWLGFVARARRGGVAEWLKAHAWRACIGETLSRVRIPLPPPAFSEVKKALLARPELRRGEAKAHISVAEFSLIRRQPASTMPGASPRTRSQRSSTVHASSGCSKKTSDGAHEVPGTHIDLTPFTSMR